MGRRSRDRSRSRSRSRDKDRRSKDHKKKKKHSSSKHKKSRKSSHRRGRHSKSRSRSRSPTSRSASPSRRETTQESKQEEAKQESAKRSAPPPAGDDGVSQPASKKPKLTAEADESKQDEIAKRRERMRLWREKKKKEEEEAKRSETNATDRDAALSEAAKKAKKAAELMKQRLSGIGLSLKGGPKSRMKKPKKVENVFAAAAKKAGDTSAKESKQADDDVDPLDAFMAKLEPPPPPKEHQPEQEPVGFGKGKRKKKKEATRFYGDENTLGEDDIKLKEEGPTWLQRQESNANKKELKKVDHDKIDYPPFRKDLYIEAKEIAELTDEDVKKIREKELEGVKIRGKNCPKPISKWTQCGLPRKVLDVIHKHDYKTPFPIQRQGIPAIMSGRDCIACAKTGSGKTLAFVLPMLRHVLDQPPLGPDDGPIGIVMAPTRELAVQIYNETKKFAKPLGLRVVAVYGGAGVAEQINALRAGTEIIIATPGRLIDVLCANSGRVTNLRRCTYVVLDEADRMFDMGFAPQIMMVIENIRPDRQTVMFSATFPKTVELLARKTLTKPVEIIIGGRSVASGTVQQIVELRPSETKFKRVLELLGKWYQKGNILIFCDRQESVDTLFKRLTEAGYPSLALHGGMDQNDRDYTIMDFKSKLRTIMVATSIVARGLDVKDLILVINYTVPNHYEDYVHRVGRTGRAGNTGTAITFITPDEERFAPDILKALEASKQVVPEDLKDMAQAYRDKVKAGLVQWKSTSGFVGNKGYKFDEEEAKAKKKAMQAQRQAYGVEEEAEDEEENAEDAVDKELQEKKEQAEAEIKAKIEAATQSAPKDAKKPVSDMERQLAAAKAAAAAARKALKAQGEEAAKNAVSNVIELSEKARLKQSQEQAKRIAEAMSARLQFGGRSSKAAPTSTETNAPGHFSDEIEINDYPQHARWKVTHKGSLDAVLENTDCAVTTKGSYVPLGRKPQEGERKLYLLIEGRDERAVAHTKNEIRRILEEAALNARPEKDRYAKYSVI